jgi:hypothetical protein
VKGTFDISRCVSEFLDLIFLSSFDPLFSKTGVSRQKLTKSLEGRGDQKSKKEKSMRVEVFMVVKIFIFAVFSYMAQHSLVGGYQVICEEMLLPYAG